MMLKFSSATSISDEQWLQVAVIDWPTARSVTGPPQFGQAKVRGLPGARASGAGSEDGMVEGSPSITIPPTVADW